MHPNYFSKYIAVEYAKSALRNSGPYCGGQFLSYNFHRSYLLNTRATEQNLPWEYHPCWKNKIPGCPFYTAPKYFSNFTIM
jgi:hypothetical protein